MIEEIDPYYAGTPSIIFSQQRDLGIVFLMFLVSKFVANNFKF